MFLSCLLLVSLWQQVQLHIVGCPSTELGLGKWVHNTKLGKCYGSATRNHLSFGDAERLCRTRGAHLAMPRNQAEVDAVIEAAGELLRRNKQIPLRIVAPRMWIGLDYIAKGSWTWADGRDLYEVQSRWGPGAPGGRDSYKDCVTMKFSGKIFEDQYCTTRHGAFCETSDVDVSLNVQREMQRCPDGWTYFDCGENCYQVSSTKHTWNEASNVCSVQQAMVAMPKTTRQHRAIRTMLRVGFSEHPSLEAWIGLWRPKAKTYRIFNWIDGTVPSGWLNTAQMIRGQDDDCCAVNLKGDLNMFPCEEKRYIVCEKPQNVLVELDQSKCGIAHSHLIKKRNIAFNIDTNIFNTKLYNPKGRNRKRNTDSNPNPQELFGNKSNNFEDFPWTVTIYLDQLWYCSGVLISPTHVLTTAYCVTDYNGREIETWRLHVRLLSDHVQLYYDSKNLEAVHMIRIHDQYRNEKPIGGEYHMDYDIAVIELKRTLHVDCLDVSPACYPVPQVPPYHGYTCVLAGRPTNGKVDYCTFDGSQLRLSGETETNILKDMVPSCRARAEDYGSPLMCTDSTTSDRTWILAGVTQGTYASTWARLQAGQGFKLDEASSENFIPFSNVKYMVPWIRETLQETVRSVSKVYYETVCDAGYLKFSCNHGRPPTIQIVTATYGRESKYRCVTRTVYPHCSSDVKPVIAKRCDGRNTCEFMIEETLLGNPCPQTNKYFQMTYRCVDYHGRIGLAAPWKDGTINLDLAATGPDKFKVTYCDDGDKFNDVAVNMVAVVRTASLRKPASFVATVHTRSDITTTYDYSLRGMDHVYTFQLCLDETQTYDVSCRFTDDAGVSHACVQPARVEFVKAPFPPKVLIQYTSADGSVHMNPESVPVGTRVVIRCKFDTSHMGIPNVYTTGKQNKKISYGSKHLYGSFRITTEPLSASVNASCEGLNHPSGARLRSQPRLINVMDDGNSPQPMELSRGNKLGSDVILMVVLIILCLAV